MRRGRGLNIVSSTEHSPSNELDEIKGSVNQETPKKKPFAIINDALKQA